MTSKFTIVLLSIIIIIGCNSEKGNLNEISFNTHIRPILSDKCFKCHGPDANKRATDFRLDNEASAFAALKDYKNKYGIVPGHPESSEVYLRIISKDADFMMPPPESKLTLTENEIKLIKRWIEIGGVYQTHWSFIPLREVKLPEVKNKWVYNEIDYFILDKLQDMELEPSQVKYDASLLKRMMHDITGLPPTLTQQEEFEKNPSKKNYEKLLDKALANAHYGEKMAIFWMDLARYADSHGYQDDGLRTMWPWRDWVIHAFNSNYNYQKFITWQLAGDLLPDKNKETILASGFNRNHKITQEGGVIDEEYRIEYVTDRTNTFGKGLLAMTFECAKCHDHKYDAISQKEYFSTFAFFNQLDEKGLVGDITAASLADPPFLTISKADRQKDLPFMNQSDTGMVNVMVMKDSIGIRETYILERGQYDRPKEIVHPSTPKAILKYDSKKYGSNRLGLAKWMFDNQNPLTARVFVNFMWQEFFGKGIVKTSGDFGLQGDLPSHPELLDWMAYDFMTNGWDIKRLVKQIAMSSTYCQSSIITKEKSSKDPENVYLSRGPRLRLSAELLKDHILATSELLNTTIGGPSVKPYQPKGLWESATSGRGQLATYVEDEGDKRYRRALYHFIKRTVPPPSMLIFDASNRDQCEVKRTSTTTPLQSLVLMNDLQVLEASRHIAIKMHKEKTELTAQLNKLFKRIICRNPRPKEIEKLVSFYNETKTSLNHQKAKDILLFGNYKEPNGIDLKSAAAMMQTVQLLFNLEETSIR